MLKANETKHGRKPSYALKEKRLRQVMREMVASLEDGSVRALFDAECSALQLFHADCADDYRQKHAQAVDVTDEVIEIAHKLLAVVQ